jgi:hypothetical protein
MIVRVLLDTCAVRKHIHGDDDSIDIPAVRARLTEYKVSIPGSTFAELIEQLLDKRLGFLDWSSAVGKLDTVLDPNWPCLPNGKELAYLAGTYTRQRIDIAEERPFMQACWKHLREADCWTRLTRWPYMFKTPTGELKGNVLREDRLRTVMKDQRDGWVDYIHEMQSRLPQVARGDTGKCERALVDLMNADFGTDPNDAPEVAYKLDAMIRMLAKFTSLAIQKRDAYNPEGNNRRGDVFDLELLFALPLPAIVVTADEKFVNRLREIGAEHAGQVVTIAEFNQHVRAGTLAGLVGRFRTPADQHRWWQEAAYFHWLGRQCPPGDDWADWFATEPIA